MNVKKVFISRNYKARFSAAGKAKIDCETALEEYGFENIGLPQTTYTSGIPNFFMTLMGTILGLIRLQRGSVLCVQYPTKKYYNFIVKVAKLKQCKVVTIIHDLRSHRKQKMKADTEIDSLNRNDVIISHNTDMTQSLQSVGLTTKTVDLNIFDYYCDYDRNDDAQINTQDTYRLVFAGMLEKRKNGFLYQLDDLNSHSFTCNLYGIGFNKDALAADSIIDYKGVFPADEIVNRLEGDFGIVWDGISKDECAGSFGEYLKINNPHKTSMYLRAGLPIIIWDKAAMAKFVQANNVGIAVASLADVDQALQALSYDDYQTMKKNAQKVSEQLGNGAFFKAAIGKAIDIVT